MPILRGDITFVTSVVMDDVGEGGGAPTGHRVVDGQSNEIFSDISELDRAGGNVSLRKIFVAVETDDTDTYLDANVIVAEPPTDPNVSVTLFSTKSTFDRRTEAARRVEAYLAPAPERSGFLLENHIAGQRVIQIFQRTTERLPNVGETFALVYNEGLPNELQQFVRIIKTSSVERTYTDAQGRPYQVAVVSAELSDALRYDFPGTAPNEFFRRGDTKTKIRETSVADAAVYSGVTRTATPIDIGDLATQVQSVFTQLVPSAQTEIPLVDTSAAGNSQAIVPAGDGVVSYTTSAQFNSATSLSLGNPITPGSLTIAIGGTTLTDTGGQLFDGATAIGTIDYPRGVVSFAGLVSPYSGTKTITFLVAAAPTRISDTGQVPVTPESRAYNYIVSVVPPPAAGSALVSYRSQGRWYDLRDNGGGVLRGTDTAYGVGSVNYASGAIAVTVGALPDVGSAVLFSWGTRTNYTDRSDISVAPSAVTVALADAPLHPGSLDISWNDGAARTANDNGAGVISGNATGTVDYQTGVVRITPVNLPLGGQEYTFTYSTADATAPKTAAFPSPSRNGNQSVTLDLGFTNVRPGTVKISYALADVPDERPGSVNLDRFTPNTRAYARDNGIGGIVGELGRDAGTINYATGVVTLFPDGPAIVLQDSYRAYYGDVNYVGMRSA